MIRLRLLQRIAALESATPPHDPVGLLLLWSRIETGGELASLLAGVGGDITAFRSALETVRSSRLKVDCDPDASAPQLLLALCGTSRLPVARALREAGFDVKKLKEQLRTATSNPVSGLESALSPAVPEACRDLTAEAAAGAFDSLEPRPESDRLAEILMSEHKPHAVLTGPSGCGKTSVARLLALAMASGTAPPGLGVQRVHEVSMGDLIAGTRYRGDFEERLRAVFRADRSTVVFIDEIHLIVGAGRAADSPLDAANILKPVLTRAHGPRVVGATTTEEYRRWIASEAALARRFQELPIDEPASALSFLKRQAAALAARHAVAIRPAQVARALEMAGLRRRSGRLDRAVDLLDAAMVAAKRRGSAALGDGDLKEAFARRTGAPATLRADLIARVAGQDAAADVVASTIARRPRGAWLVFTGPAGVGKRRFARVLAELLFGSRAAFHDFDGDVSVVQGPPGLLFLDDADGASFDALRALRRRERLDGWVVVLAIHEAIESRTIGFARVGVGEPEAGLPRDLAEGVDATARFGRLDRAALERVLDLMVEDRGASPRLATRLRPRLDDARGPADVERRLEEELTR